MSYYRGEDMIGDSGFGTIEHQKKTMGEFKKDWAPARSF